MKKSLVLWFLLLAMLLNLTGCGTTVHTSSPSTSGDISATDGEPLDLLSAIIRQSSQEKPATPALSGSMADFSLALLQSSYRSGENTILSPYSMYLTLAMTANGAAGDTRSQMESILGMSVEELNLYALNLQTTNNAEVTTANSIWLRDSFSPLETYLQTLKDHYDPQVYSVPFDPETLNTMNRWIETHTNGRITNALDRMDANVMLYLINTLTFDASWKTLYTTQDITPQTFYGTNGEQVVEMMTSTENRFLYDGKATGFLKSYENERYSFMALLPNEGISLESYLSSLSGDQLVQMIQTAESTKVVATMPKVQLETAVEMKDVLTSMGMVDAFTMNADLSGINGEQDLYISRILHKTYLQVDEAGTQAGAVTIEEIVSKGVVLNQEYVFLNRPYLMGIYDHANDCFLFLGTVENP